MKKRYMVFALAAAVVLSLSACGGEAPGENTGDSKNEQTVVNESGLSDDGKGDPIPSTDIPILMGGALPFTGMESIQHEEYDDGGYYYVDATEDGKIYVVNTAEASTFDSDEQTIADYLTERALTLTSFGEHEILSCEENEDYSKNLSYPVYIVKYTSGENEDVRSWTVFAMDTDAYTYLYGFCEMDGAAEGMDETYQDIFAGLYLSEEESE